MVTFKVALAKFIAVIPVHLKFLCTAVQISVSCGESESEKFFYFLIIILLYFDFQSTDEVIRSESS